MAQYIDKSVLVAKIEKLRGNPYYMMAIKDVLLILDTLEVKEVNIADMADDYYDGLMEEVADWMDECTMCHCRLAYYNGCKDVLAKLQKGE